MQHHPVDIVLDPGDYDPHFKFELDLGVGDYLLMLAYLILVLPFEALAWAAGFLRRAMEELISRIRREREPKSSGGLLSVFTKLF